MLLIATGEHTAFAELVRRYDQKLYRCAWRVLRDRSLAQDTVQDVLLKVWSRPAWKTGGASPSSWLYRLTLHSAIDNQRRRRPVVPLHETDAMESGELQREELAHSVHTLLQELPEAMCTAMVLCYFEGMRHAEAAAVMKRSTKAVESLLARARAVLRERLSQRNIHLEDLVDD